MTDEVITATEAATILSLADGATARRTLSRRGVIPIGRAPGRGGESLYRRDHVEHERDYPPLRGKVPPDIADLTRRVLGDAAPPGASWQREYMLDDGVRIMVSWGPSADTATTTGDGVNGHRKRTLSRDADELAAQLGPLVRAARRDLAKRLRVEQELAAIHVDHLDRVRAARVEVERVRTLPPGQHGELMTALPTLRHEVALAREVESAAGGLISAAEIAEAARISLTEVNTAH
jgi:hypothetical protein